MAGKNAKHAVLLAKKLAAQKRKRFAGGGDAEELIRPRPYSLDPVNFPKGKELPIGGLLPSAEKAELKLPTKNDKPATEAAKDASDSAYRPPTGVGGGGDGVGTGMSAPDASSAANNQGESSWSSGTTTGPTGIGFLDNAIANPAGALVNTAISVANPALGLANTALGLAGMPNAGSLVSNNAAPISSSIGYTKGTSATSQPATSQPAVAAPPASVPMPTPVDRTGRDTAQEETDQSVTDAPNAGSLSSFGQSGWGQSGPVGSGIGGMGGYDISNSSVGGPLGGANVSTAENGLSYGSSDMWGTSVGPLSDTYEGVGTYGAFGADLGSAPSAPDAPSAPSAPGDFSIGSDPSGFGSYGGKGSGIGDSDSDGDSDGDGGQGEGGTGGEGGEGGDGGGGGGDGGGDGGGFGGGGDGGDGGGDGGGGDGGGDGGGGDGGGGGGDGGGGGGEKRGGFIKPRHHYQQGGSPYALDMNAQEPVDWQSAARPAEGSLFAQPRQEPRQEQRPQVAQVQERTVEPTSDRYGVFAFGTNDYRNPEAAVRAAQDIYANAKSMGMTPVFVLPNASHKQFAPVSNALRTFAEERGITYEVPTYESKDPLHLTKQSAQDIAKRYPNAFVGGDSNSVRLQDWGYGRKLKDRNTYVDPRTGQVLGQVSAPSSSVANWIAQYRKMLETGRYAGGRVAYANAGRVGETKIEQKDSDEPKLASASPVWNVEQAPSVTDLVRLMPDTGPQGRTLAPETITGSVGVPLGGGTLSAFGGTDLNYASMPNVPIKKDLLYPTYGVSYQKRFAKGGPVVDRALMVVSTKAKRRRGRPD